MCISVYANGFISGAGTHVSVFVHLMRGEYDDWLVWPFRGDITMQLVNQKSDEDHYERTASFIDPRLNFSQRVMKGLISAYGCGFRQFISHWKLQSTTSQYLKNDCLKFRVTKIVVHSV